MNNSYSAAQFYLHFNKRKLKTEREISDTPYPIISLLRNK